MASFRPPPGLALGEIRSGAALEQAARDDEPLDLARPLPDAVDPQLAVEPRSRVLDHVPAPAEDLHGVTEVRAGVYVFFDLFMAGVGVCTLDDIALSVLTTVIGHQPDKGWTIVDAGWMAMSRDRGTQNQTIDQGYGVVCGIDGKPIEDYVMTSANQEHGIIARRGGPGGPPG